MIKKFKINFLNLQPKTYNPKPNSGQVVLMLVLITIVGLTIALSLISRTVTDIRISSQIEQSNRAFSAAEAGVESALKGAVVNATPVPLNLPNASASYTVSKLGDDASILAFPLTTPNSSQTVWFMDHNPDQVTLNETTGYYYPAASSFDICWGTDAGVKPAIIVSIYYKSGTNYKVVRSAYDPGSGQSNNFIPASNTGNYCGGAYKYKKTISVTQAPPGSPTGDSTDGFSLPGTVKLMFVRIKPIYDSAAIAFAPTTKIPLQGKVITSVGRTTTNVARKIQVIQGYSVLPDVMDFGLFGQSQQ